MLLFDDIHFKKNHYFSFKKTVNILFVNVRDEVRKNISKQ